MFLKVKRRIPFLSILGVLILLIAIPITVNRLQKQQEIRSQAASSSERLVDVFIDKEFSNHDSVTSWLNEAFITLNSRLGKAGIQKKFKIRQIIIEDPITIDNPEGNCQEYQDPPFAFRSFECVHSNDAIILYLFASMGISTARYNKTVNLHLNSTRPPLLNDITYTNFLIHEFGHVLGLPDYYGRDILPEANEVVPIGLVSSIKDIMYNGYLYENFSEFSSELLRLGDELTPPGANYFNLPQIVPKKIVLKILDIFGIPFPDVKVEVFPATKQPGQKINEDSSDAVYNRYQYKVPNIVSFEDLTSKRGELYLETGDIYCHKRVPLSSSCGEAALLKITNKGEVRYLPIPPFYLEQLYLEQGRPEIVTISMRFTHLWLPPKERQERKALSIREGNIIPVPSLSKEQREKLEMHVAAQEKENSSF